MPIALHEATVWVDIPYNNESIILLREKSLQSKHTLKMQSSVTPFGICPSEVKIYFRSKALGK